MAYPHFEVPAGAIDGVNTVFTVSMPYKPGTTAVFLNGLLLRSDYPDGWVETDPAAGLIALKEPPRETKITPDVVQVFYLDTSPDELETVFVEYLHGRLEDVSLLEGRLLPRVSMGAIIETPVLEAVLSGEDALHGRVFVEEHLRGVIKAVC